MRFCYAQPIHSNPKPSFSIVPIAYLLFCLFPCQLSAQAPDRATQQANFQLKIARAISEIRVDGDLSESTWQNAAVATDFWLKWPRDGAPAPEQTEVRCAYDDRYLYIGITAHDTTPNYVIQSLKRDVNYWDSDGVGVVIDPANTANNGYFFGVSPKGVQTEGLLSVGNDDMDTNWDNTWMVETRTYADRWTAEYAIPLRILRFKEGQTAWGINFVRNDLTNGVYSTWSRVPFQFDGLDLGWTGALQWDASPRRTKGNYNLIPYATTSLSRDFENKEPWTAKPNAGLDAKIGIGSGLNLDVTANPDFSQVEIDEQVVNLSRFDVQLPEKRTFFLENADIFGGFGFPVIRPFFSRSIGLDEDGRPLPILGGLRLTGNLDADTRIGALTMQTGARGNNPSRNFSALAVNRRLFGRSTVAAYFLDREDFEKGDLQKNKFSRNAGFEFTHISTDGRWTAWLTHHRSFKPNISANNWWSSLGFEYKNRRFNFLIDGFHTGENYYADLGFALRIENYDALRDTALRIGYNHLFSNASYRIFPKKESGQLNYTEISSEFYQVFNLDGSLNESSNNFNASWNFKNTSEFNLSVTPNWAHVPVSFRFDDEDDFTRCPPLPAGVYRYLNASAEWTSDGRKPLFLSLSTQMGGFYNGRQYGGKIELTGRIRTFANIRLAAEYNLLDFPEPYCDVPLFNLTPRIEVFFAKNLWWTTFLQYNTQSDNFNINSRLQWRFRPMSDLFVVYTDNYAVQIWGARNRALTVKANYWF